MMNYARLLRGTFELQRQSLQQGQQVIEQMADFQRRVGQATVDGFVAGEPAQRKTLELQQNVLHNLLDVVEANTLGTDEVIDEFRETVDEQYETLLENHAEVFNTVADEFEDSIGAADEFGDEYLTIYEDQLKTLYEAHEDLEDESVEAIDRLHEQLEQAQDRTEEFQIEVRGTSEQTAESIDI